MSIIMSVLTGVMISGFCVSDDSFVVGSSFELLFNIRPRSLNGLLLHVGDSSRNQYLTVYMLRGEVRLDCDDAASAAFTWLLTQVELSLDCVSCFACLNITEQILLLSLGWKLYQPKVCFLYMWLKALSLLSSPGSGTSRQWQRKIHGVGEAKSFFMWWDVS